MSDQETTAAVEFAIVVRCSDEFGGLLEADTEFDFSITPDEPVDAWEQEVEDALEGGAKPTDELLQSAETRTFRVTVPAGTPGESGVARALRDSLTEALEGTGVDVTAFEGESVPGQDNEAVAKLVFEGVRSVDVVWAESKITGWLWARPGLSGGTGLGGSPLFRAPSTPRAPLKPPWWPPFAPPSLPTQPPSTGTPGSPRLKGWKIKKIRPTDASPKMRRLEGGGVEEPPGGHWRRLAISFRFDPFAPGVTAFPVAFGSAGDWRGLEFLIPPGSTAQEEAAAVTTALIEEQAGWPDLWKACLTDVVVQLQGDSGGSRGRVHWQVELAPAGVSALLASEENDGFVLGGQDEKPVQGTTRGVSPSRAAETVRFEISEEQTATDLPPPSPVDSSVPGFRFQEDPYVPRRAFVVRPQDACWIRIRNARPIRMP